MPDDWLLISIWYDGTSEANGPVAEYDVDHDRETDDGSWLTVLNLPHLVVVEWQKTPFHNYIQYQIYIHQTLTSAA